MKRDRVSGARPGWPGGVGALTLMRIPSLQWWMPLSLRVHLLPG